VQPCLIRRRIFVGADAQNVSRRQCLIESCLAAPMRCCWMRLIVIGAKVSKKLPLSTFTFTGAGRRMPIGFSPRDYKGSHNVWGTQLNDQGSFQPIDLE
jgi:hypothetical protein